MPRSTTAPVAASSRRGMQLQSILLNHGNSPILKIVGAPYPTPLGIGQLPMLNHPTLDLGSSLLRLQLQSQLLVLRLQRLIEQIRQLAAPINGWLDPAHPLLILLLAEEDLILHGAQQGPIVTEEGRVPVACFPALQSERP